MPNDEINPSHYKTESGLEAIDVIEAFFEGESRYYLGNAFKYMARAGKKTPEPTVDVRKAIWYLARYLQEDGL